MRTLSPMRTVAVLGSVTLAASIALPTSLALPVSAAPAGAQAATGTVTDASGHAMAGAMVRLYAWPSGNALKRLRIGQQVPIRLVGSARASASGRFAITMTSPAAAERSAAPSGIVNLELDAMSPKAFGFFSFSRRAVRTSHGIVLDDASTNGAPRAVPAENVTIKMTPTHRIPHPVPCGWAKIRTYKPSWTVVAGTYSTTSHTTEAFTYSQGQSSNLGVGQSSSGKKGTFTGAGTASFSASFSQDFRPHGGHASILYKTKFIHSEFGFSCSHGFIKYQTKATDFAGGTKSVRTAAPRAVRCVPEQRGSQIHKTTSTAFTFSAGYTIPVINASLSAQTGYDTQGALTYVYSRAGRLCGTNGFPGQTPRRLVAKHR